MAKVKIGKLFDKIIVQGCSLRELTSYELLYTKTSDGIIVLQRNDGTKLTGDWEDYVKPSGTKKVNNTNKVDVSNYEYVQVTDKNLKAENIKEGITILGVTGTYDGV